MRGYRVTGGARPCVELRRATRSHAHLLVDRSGFGWTRADRRLRWGARGVSGAGDPGFGVSAAVTVVHPDSETPMPGATAPSAAVRRCTEDGANVCSSGLLAEPVTHVRGAGLLLPRAAAAGDGRLNHLRDGPRAPSRSHQPARRRPTARMAPQFPVRRFSLPCQARNLPARPPNPVASAGGARHHVDPCLAGVWQGACAGGACRRPAAAVPAVPAAVHFAPPGDRLGRRRSRLVTVVAADKPVPSCVWVVLGAGRGPAWVCGASELGQRVRRSTIAQSGSAGAVSSNG